MLLNNAFGSSNKQELLLIFLTLNVICISVVKVIEVIDASERGFDDAVKVTMEEASKSVNNV
jgi:hypothetical protein